MEFNMMIRLASAAVIAALMTKAPIAQSTSTQMNPSARLMTALPANGTTVTNYYKQDVYDPSGNKVGAVSDLIVEKDGRITAAMVGVGGFLGIDEKNVAIPFDAFKLTQKNNKWQLTVNTTKDALKSAPGFKYDRDTTTWVSDKSASTADRTTPRMADTKAPRK
jgi:sporulation protein YlmC with PRC-barrel domain